MFGLNIDPNNPRGNPDPSELRDIGVEIVRYTYHDQNPGDQLDPARSNFFRDRLNAYHQAGIKSLLILTYDTFPNRPAPDAPDPDWDAYIERFARRAGQIAQLSLPWQPAIQVWNEPDHPVHVGYVPTLREAVFGRMLRRSYDAIKAVSPNLLVVAGGLAAGDPGWLSRVIQSRGGTLPADIVAFHPYGQRPDPDWPNPNWAFGYLGSLLNNYYQAGGRKPIWITEMGVREEDLGNNRDQVAEFLRRYYNAITNRYKDKVQQLFWFCYSDGMVPSFGLRDANNAPKPCYLAFRELALAARQPGEPEPPPTEPPQVANLDRLVFFAQYLEQQIVFGQDNQVLQGQMEAELKGNRARLTTSQIQQLAGRILAGSTFTLSSQEIDSLNALQQQMDLYGTLRCVVLATHQRTGALTGRMGLHTRISAETERNAETNIAAVLGALAHLQPGNRMIVMDMVKANADDSKLQGPDVFETNVYGQHRNGLVDNHAWNLQKLVRAIRDRGYQNRVLLILRLDGPDGGANVNVFNSASRARYELAILKVIRYLQAVLPNTPFKLVLGNEPDLPQERLWSDPHADPRHFTVNQFAPAMGDFMKKMARQRPDVTFLCPALSGNLKQEYLSYYTNFFGSERPPNLIPSMHGYAADVAALPGVQKNLLEQQADAMRTVGGFRWVSGTEIGSSNPVADCDSLSDKSRFADVVAWVMLSREHQTPPGQDNNWEFRFEPGLNDPAAWRFADVVNRTQARVIRNIREYGGAGLAILRAHPVDRPAYAVEYVGHNTPPVMVAGQTNAVTMTVRNTSYRTWASSGPNPVRVGYHWYTGDGNEVPNTLWADHRTGLPYDLPSDQVVILNCLLGAPRVAGNYELRWDMVEEMQTWFAWQGVPTLNVAVQVKPEGEPGPEPGGLSVSASHNNQQQGEENLLQAIDDSIYTRWSSREPQQPGMWFQIDLREVQTVSHVRLHNDLSPKDYPRGYTVRVSADGQNWTRVAENPANDRPVDVTFNPQAARYVRIEQTGSDPVYWWSIHNIEISGDTLLSASASHNNVQVGGDNVRQAVDGRPDTRWSSMALQQPGMWFQVDLGQARTVTGLALDTAASPDDYPRGYVVRLSTDGSQWQEVARKDQNNGAVDVTFPARQARYVRIEQTGSAGQWWWSIHEVNVKFGQPGEGEEQTGETPGEEQPGQEPGEGPPPAFDLSASHNSVSTGTDNLLNALDDRPGTRWSTTTPQRPGMWFEIDLKEVKLVTGLALDTAGSANDYPRGYVVRLSTDRSQWDEIARKDQNDRALDLAFSPACARYIRVEQTGSDPIYWWSIHQLRVTATALAPASEVHVVKVSASHNNVDQGYDNLRNVLDGDPATRWSTTAPQRPGMWFEIELSAVRRVGGLTLDTAGSTNDYPRGYVVRLSTDGSRWTEVARKDQNDRALDITFPPRCARRIRIEQTGTSAEWWWSIHRIGIK